MYTCTLTHLTNYFTFIEHIFTDDNSEDGQNYDPEDDAYDEDEDISEEEKLSMMREGNIYMHILYICIHT